MPGLRNTLSYTSPRCLRALQNGNLLQNPARVARHLSQGLPLRTTPPATNSTVESQQPDDAVEEVSKAAESPSTVSKDEQAQGAMSRRLQEATEDALFEGGRAGRKAVEEAGFSEELKMKLLEKVEAAKFRSENASAFAEAGLSSNVGSGSRGVATGQPWTGLEPPEDSILRMLDDAHKPLKPGMRGPAKIPSPVVDMRMKGEAKQRPGQRLASARDKTSIYAISKDMDLTEKEREDMRRELRERFTPGARAMPNTIQGLAALANERIEDAIARGQFKVSLMRSLYCAILISCSEYPTWKGNRKRSTR